MAPLDYFAWIVLITLLVSVVVIWIVLAMLPGKIAHQRGHPNAAAINVAGWLGALAAGVFWPIAMIWAFTAPSGPMQMSTGDVKLKTPPPQETVSNTETALTSKKESQA